MTPARIAELREWATGGPDELFELIDAIEVLQSELSSCNARLKGTLGECHKRGEGEYSLKRWNDQLRAELETANARVAKLESELASLGNLKLREKAYFAWYDAIGRCHNTEHKSFPRYGGRGISVAQEWRDSFEVFFAHIGPPPARKSHLDRIDNNGNYAPGNIRWVSQARNQRNKENNVYVTINGQTKCVAEWCEVFGTNPETSRGRIRSGWDPVVAVSTPSRSKKSSVNAVLGREVSGG